jgi:hypothetical protein
MFEQLGGQHHPLNVRNLLHIPKHNELTIDNVRYTTLTHQQVLMRTAFRSLELAE